MQPIQPKKLPPEVQAQLAKFDLNRCYTCGTCSSGCPITGDPDMEGWDTRKVLRMLSFGMIDELVNSKFPWVCTGCGRCTFGCPMGIDIWPIIFYLRTLRPRDQVPGVLHKGTEMVLKTGNNMGIPKDDYLATMYDMGKEMADEGCPGFHIPIDRQDSKVFFFPNSKEVGSDYEDQKWWWKIFYAAKEQWTIPSENWEAVDWALFSANPKATQILAQRKIDMMRQFNIERMIMPDCGGGSYGCRVGMKMCAMENPGNTTNFVYLYDYLIELLKSGRIKVDKSVHAGKKFTWHDSCKHGRELLKHFGVAYFDEPRWILSQCVDDFVEMYPNRENNYCCGAGGGNWPMPYEKNSAMHGRFKKEQIMNSGADVVVVGCSNCRDMMMRRLPKYYPDLAERGVEIKYIWQIIAEALVFEPWSDDEIAAAQEEAAAQWERLGVETEE